MPLCWIGSKYITDNINDQFKCIATLRYGFRLQYLASVTEASATAQASHDGCDEPPLQPTVPVSDDLAELEPSTTMQVQSQEVQVCLPKEGSDFGCQFNTRGEQLMMKAADTQTEVTFSTSSTQVEQGDFPVDNEEEEEDAFGKPSATSITPEVSPQKDATYLPPKSECLSDDSNTSQSEDEGEETSQPLNPQDDTKFIVFKQELLKLLNRCPECGATVAKKHQSTQGTLLSITLTCKNGHKHVWSSQPMIEGMAAGNLLLSSSILLSGSTYAKVSSLADILKLKFFSEKTFYNIQDKYLFPVINDFWQKEQNSIFSEIKDKDLWLSGDGRCDSPGHNAKYGTYTMIDQETDKIVDFQVVQVTEVSSSNAMEREGFKRCMNKIQNNGGQIKVVATDRHVGIRADMKNNFPEVDHQYDVWHLSKSITKKLTEKSKKKECGELAPWIKSISNHLWWCAETCEGNKELLREKWISIVHHTANIHSWDSADLYHECAHPPIPRNEARTKRWLRPGSAAHNALKEVVFDKNLLRDIQLLSQCCHTGNLEVYHSVQTRYVPKRQHFSYKGMNARSQLAALDHNANTGREQATVTRGTNQGELKYKVVFPKHTKEWVAKPIMEKTSKDHLNPIVDAIVERKKQKPRERSATVTAPHIPKNIASKPRPPREDVIAKHTSRFSNN